MQISNHGGERRWDGAPCLSFFLSDCSNSCHATFVATLQFYDLAGSTSFIACTYLSLFQPWDNTTYGNGSSTTTRAIHPRQIIASCTTVLWALYLGSFLFNRALKSGDRRFDKVKKNPSQFLVYWLVQGVWVALTALPV